MKQPHSPFVLVQALANLGRAALLERLARRGLTDIGMPDVKLLWCLDEAPITVQQAAQMMGTTNQFAARTVAKLQAEGLVEVGIHTTDKRASAVTATRKGAELVAILAEERDVIEQDWRARIGAEELASLARSLGRLVP